MNLYRTKLSEKLKESLEAVVPIIAIVLILSFTIAPVPPGILMAFIIGAILLVVGMMFFTLGAEMSMTPMGERIGTRIAQSKRLPVIIGLCFVLGFIITISEPDLQVLAGQVNKDLVALLKGRGVGLCGMDGHMIMCKRKSDVDLGYVGEIEKVNTTLIDHLLADSFIPVIATVGMDDNGIPYNINADTAAAEIAIALHAEKLVSMTDIVGLLYDKNDESTLIPEVEVSEIEGYKAAGVIAGGMLPKIEGMADAIYQGVHEAVIIDGRVPHSILLEMFSDRGAGTMFYRRGNH